MATREFNIIKLHFNSPLHISDNRDDYGISLTTIHSDTLYAAITSCLAKLEVPIPENGDLGCTISSMFPFYQESQDSEAVYFFPRPLKMQLPANSFALENAKKIKKVQWIDKHYFQKVINGDYSFFENENIIENITNKYLSINNIDCNFISSYVAPRVSVSRSFEDAKPFYMDRVCFKGYSGLYCIVEGDTTLLEKGLKLLELEGIGTDRNVGNGFFTYSKEKIKIDIPNDFNKAISLSVYIPNDKVELKNLVEGDNIAYDFTRRGGWITDTPYNSLRKNAIYAFLPGSVFSINSNSDMVKGRIVNLQPMIENNYFTDKNIDKLQHPIWRCGKSIFIPAII